MSENLRNQIEEQAEIHQVLSNPVRLLILCTLEEKELSVGEISEQIGATLQNTSQHLRLMKDKGVLEARREGQTILYRITPGEMGKVYRQMLTCFDTEN